MSLEAPKLPMKVDTGALTVANTDLLKAAFGGAMYELGASKVANETGHWSSHGGQHRLAQSCLRRGQCMSLEPPKLPMKVDTEALTVANTDWLKSAFGGSNI